MKTLQEWPGTVMEFVPALVVVAMVVVLVQLVHWLIRVRQRKKHELDPFPAQVVTLVAVLIAAVGVVLVLPIENATRSQLFALLGLVLTAIIAFSSTTFASNVLAGLVIRSSRHLRPGYFVLHDGDLGRITEIGLIQTELQTRHRNFTYLPNTTLLSEKVTVVNPDATVVSAEVSLGYDVRHTDIDRLLVAAAEKIGLEEPYVRVRGLGDFSVSYRVYGLLREVKLLITARSDLYKAILDSLHGAGIEIVSPGFMNQRVLPADKVFIPRPVVEKVGKIPEEMENSPEKLIFDKAEQAERLESLKDERTQLIEAVKELERSEEKLEGDAKVQAEREIVRHNKRIEVLESILRREQKEQ
jgi:small-conductance mechanosensitive channel